MKTLTNLVALVAAAVLLVGCGEDADLTGLYQVTYHTYSADNCDVEGADETDPPYFRMEKSEFFGVTLFSYSGCDAVDDPECTGFANVATSFTQPIDNGWKGAVSYSSGVGGQCTLGYSEGTAVVQDGGIRIVLRAWAESADLPEAACDPEEAESRGKAMPCDGHEVIVGTLVAE